MKRSIYAFLVIVAMSRFGLAQNDARELLLVRSQNITNDLLKDAADLSSMQRAVLWVKLAKGWWPEDPKRARTWIGNAIEVVEQVPNKEKPEEREKRLETARVLLAIVTPLDQKLSNRLLTVLNPDKSTQNEDSGTAFALVEAATRILEDNPKRAAELAALALRTGEAHNIDQLLYGLRARDPKLADSLFVQALALAKQNPGGMFANILTYVAFPADRGRDPSLPVPPDALRIELLQILMPSTNGENNGSNCGAVAWLAPLYREFERLLPQQWLILRQAINTCQSASPHIEQRIKDSSSDQRLDSVESLLRAAADAKEIEIRTNYKYRAAALAKEHNDYELALKILNDLSTEERTLMAEAWDSCRWDWAADGAIEHYKNSRFREMSLLLDGVPSDLQPLAKAAFIYRVQRQGVSETGPVIQILNDAITGLRRSNIPAADKYNWYFPLLHATVKYQFADANAVLKDAIASLNQVKEGTELNTTDYLRYIGPPLVEMDEFVVKDALATITLVQFRAQLRLALLDATLQRLKATSRN
jgi:hypothetical protein